MSRKVIILISVIFIFLLALYFTQSNQEQSQTADQGNEEQNNTIDLGLLEKTYKMETKVILSNYLRQAQDEEFLTALFIKQTKDQLLGLLVPTKFKDLHINLILALTKAEEYFQDEDKEKLQESQVLINQAKKGHEWLNN